jgi:hypothetical protein
MLSLRNGLLIAESKPESKDKKPLHIFLRQDDDDNDDNVESEIETTPENLVNIFKRHLQLNKKLSSKDIELMTELFKNELSTGKSEDLKIPPKLSRIYDASKKHANNSTKKFLDFTSEKINLIPKLDEKAFSRVYCTGLSGSGKSTYICDMIMNNKIPKNSPGVVLLFSPIRDDPSLAKIKNLIHIDLESFYSENDRAFDVEDIPEGSIIIFDDVFSADKHLIPIYQDLLNKISERGRHLKFKQLYVVSHNPLAGSQSKVPIRESQFMLVFPRSNPRDVRVLLKTYCGYTTEEIDQLMELKTRGVLVKKTVPRYAISQHNVILY